MQAEQIEIENNLKRFEPFFSNEYGIINYFHIIQNEPHFPNLFYGACRLCDISQYNGFPFNFSVGGCGETKYEAIFSSLGEAIERYSASIIPVNNLIFDSYSNLKSRNINALNPESCPLFSKKQYSDDNFKFKPINKDSFLQWTKGKILRTDDPIFVPAAFVYLPYIYKKEETIFNHSTTTGLSFNFNKKSAILNGLNEVIERDCFTITWLSKLSVPRVNYKNTGYESVNRLLNKTYKNFRGNLTVYDITNDLDIPSFLAVIEMQDKNDILPSTCVGASSNPDKEKALYKTIMEAAQTYAFASYLKQKEKNGYPFTENYNKELYNFDQNVLFYSYNRNKDGLSFLNENKKIKSIDEIKSLNKEDVDSSINYTVQKIYSLGYDPIIVDLTPDDVKSQGGYVIRTIVPGLVPLHGAYKYPHLGNPRLYEIPKKLGYYKNILKESEINDSPHPFP